MSRATQALQLAEEIAVKRSELQALEHRFFEFMGEPAPSGTTVAGSNGGTRAQTTGGIRGRFASKPESIANQIKAVLREQPTKTLTLDELIGALPNVDEKSLRGTTSRLARDHEGVKRVSRGRYRFLASKEDAQG